MSAKITNFPPPEAPAKLKPGHVQDRGTSAVAGAPKAWRNTDESALASYSFRGLLQGGNPKFMAHEREAAGNLYRGLWEALGGYPPDSTQLNEVKSGNGGPLQDRVVDACRRLAAIDSRLSANDRAILRRVCCENWWPSRAIREIDPDYKTATVPRFREALDSLITAIEDVRKLPGTFNLAKL